MMIVISNPYLIHIEDLIHKVLAQCNYFSNNCDCGEISLHFLKKNCLNVLFRDSNYKWVTQDITQYKNKNHYSYHLKYYLREYGSYYLRTHSELPVSINIFHITRILITFITVFNEHIIQGNISVDGCLLLKDIINEEKFKDIYEDLFNSL